MSGRKFQFRPNRHDPYFKDAPTNEARTVHAKEALDAFLISTGEPRKIDEEAVSDLMSDLLHYCDKFGHDGAEVLAHAERDWRMER